MTLIMNQLAEAIELSKSCNDFVINERVEGGKVSFFLKSTMNKDQLDAWQKVADKKAAWFEFIFLDSTQDPIEPKDASDGEICSLRINYYCFSENIYLLSYEGWKTLLYDDDLIYKVRSVSLLFAKNKFSTKSFDVMPWLDEPVEIEYPKYVPTSSRVKSIVKCYSKEFECPMRVEPWVISGDVELSEPSYDLWKRISIEKLALCLPNEVFSNHEVGNCVKFFGKPPKELIFTYDELNDDLFYVIQDVVDWLYLQGEEAELKHTFFSNELAREWPLDLSYCKGLKNRLPMALESARLLYKAHARTSSKDTIKNLGDLRKNLAEDIQKIVQQTRDILNGMWRDVALVFGAFVIKYSIDSVKYIGVNHIFNYIFLVLALYILISFCMAASISMKFNQLLLESRQIWRVKLYAFLDDHDYHNLAVEPLKKALNEHDKLIQIIFLFVAMVSIFLLCISLYGLGH